MNNIYLKADVVKKLRGGVKMGLFLLQKKERIKLFAPSLRRYIVSTKL